MRILSKIVFGVCVTVFVLGALFFGLSLMLGADLVRVADAVFAEYDMAQTYENFRSLISDILAYLPV